MLAPIIIAAAIIILVDSAFIWFIIRPFWTNWGKWHEIPEVPSAILQVSVVGLTAEFILFSTLSGVICPPLAFFMVAKRLWEFKVFLMEPVLAGLVIAVMSFAVLRKLTAKLKSFAWGLSAAIFCITTFVLANQTANSLQTAAIAQFSPDCISRHSFWHSIQIAGKKFQFDAHIMARKHGTYYGWSFKELGFYPIPSTVIGNINNECK